MNTIKFSYPIRGLNGQFNTFRPGKALSQKLKPGDRVELVNSRTAKVLKHATVTAVHVKKAWTATHPSTGSY